VFEIYRLRFTFLGGFQAVQAGKADCLAAVGRAQRQPPGRFGRATYEQALAIARPPWRGRLRRRVGSCAVLSLVQAIAEAL
jgi:hypothetical protein